MPEPEVIERAHKDAQQGKSPSTQAGEFVGEEMHHVRQGKHGARSPQQAIAIGRSKARRAGLPLAPPKKGKPSSRTRAQAQREANHAQRNPPAPHEGGSKGLRQATRKAARIRAKSR